MKVFSKEEYGPVRAIEMGYSIVGKPLMTTRLYNIDGILIDTGLSHLKKEVVNYCNSIPLHSVYLTHHHEDHSGNARAIMKSRSIPVFGHAITIEKLRASFPILPYQHLIWGAAPPADISPMPEKIETENYTFEAIHTPGHARDHLSYYEPNQGWLFSGDLFLGEKIKYFRADEDFGAQIESLRKLVKLDFDALFCNHNPKPTNGKQSLAAKLDYLETLQGNIHFHLQKGLGCREIMKQLEIKEVYSAKLLCGGNVSAENMVRLAIQSLSQKD